MSVDSLKTKIRSTADYALVDARIVNARTVNIPLPSITDGWRFNFRKQLKMDRFAIYILVKEETPYQIEGCLTFEMKNKIEPYIAFVEVAPHNFGKEKLYENVAACLIAFACRLSFIQASDHYKGWLAFDVIEEEKENEIKLMANYSSKYGALKFTKTTMVIPPAGGKKLIDEFLNFDYETY